jgi:hypothetical protein
VSFSDQTAAPFDRNENVLVLAFCAFLMKADLGEAGQNLLIPRRQQQNICDIQTGRSEGTRRHNHNKQQLASLQGRAYRADLNSKWFLTVKVAEFFEPQKLCFLEKTFNSPTQRRISRRFFWLIWKNSHFFCSAVNRKNALTSFLKELETSK